MRGRRVPSWAACPVRGTDGQEQLFASQKLRGILSPTTATGQLGRATAITLRDAAQKGTPRVTSSSSRCATSTKCAPMPTICGRSPMGRIGDAVLASP
eukprot:2475695-Prymnesium_polylepis.1